MQYDYNYVHVYYRSASGSDIDSSPRTAGVPLREISLRLVEGLQTGVIFPEADYLGNVKAELKKLMKQRYY